MTEEITNAAASGAMPAPSPSAVAAAFEEKPKAAAPDQSPAKELAPAEAAPTLQERARSLVDGYAHALATNSPRTQAELSQMKALFDLE